MIQATSRDGNQVDVIGPSADWREYAAIPRVEDYDNIFGDELSVPIIYEPV